MSASKQSPTGWVWAPIGEVIDPTVDQGGPELSKEFTYVDIGSIDNRTKKIVDPKLLPLSQAPSRARQRLEPDDVLVSMTRPNLNAVALLPDSLRGSIGSTGFHVLRTKHVRPSWLFYLLQTSAFVDAMTQVVQGALYPAVRPKDINSYQIPIAPIAEEERIIEEIEKHFSRLDASVAGLKRVRANLGRYRASVLKAASEGRLVPSEAELARAEGREYEPAETLLSHVLKERRARWEEEQFARMKKQGREPKNDKWKSRYEEPAQPDATGLPSLPEGWVWTTIESVGDVLLGRQRAPQYLTGKYPRPYLRVANVFEDYIDFSDVKEMDFDPDDFEKYKLEPDDILINEGQSPELVGRSAIYKGGVDGLCFQKTLHRFRRFKSAPSAKFVQTIFLAYLYTGVFRDAASLTVNIAHITLERIKPLRFPLPPLAEQERIVAEVERRLSVVRELEETIEVNERRARRLRQSILKRAFEGRLVAQDPNDEPAAILLERIKAERAATTVSTKGGRRGTRGQPGFEWPQAEGAAPTGTAAGAGEG